MKIGRFASLDELPSAAEMFELQSAAEDGGADAALAGRDFMSAIGFIGNERRAESLWSWWSQGKIDRHGLRAMILTAWDHGPRAGYVALGERRWLTLFHAAGFISDDGSALPDAEVTVWRGAETWTGGRGFAWSTSLETAQWFRDRWVARGVEASVYRTTVLPKRILAVDRASRNETEVIVNPLSLRGRHAPQEMERVSGSPDANPGAWVS